MKQARFVNMLPTWLYKRLELHKFGQTRRRSHTVNLKWHYHLKLLDIYHLFVNFVEIL